MGKCLSPGPGSGNNAAVAAVNPLRGIPSIERLLGTPRGALLAARYRREYVVETIRRVLDAVRHAAVAGDPPPGDDTLLARVETALEDGPRLRRVINATGIGLHTNLGRAALPEEALAALVEAGRGAVNLEIDLDSGRRSHRDVLVADDLCALTGAEDALVVNNNAAAVLLVLDTLARGREVVVSRGELVEIGGSFRMPDVMLKGGVRLREVGTTNRTHPDDYRRAINAETALLLKVHTSNFRILGFTAAVDLATLVGIGRGAGVPVIYDLGSGALFDLGTFGLPCEPVVREQVAAGADVVTFSGDKVLGGPQAGIIVGQRALVEQLRTNPLRRALRPDKLTFAALGATLRLYRQAPDLAAALPLLRWLTRPLDDLEAVGRAAIPRLTARLGDGYRVTLVTSEAEIGSGSAPAAPLPSRALAVEHALLGPERIAARFRAADPALLGRVHAGLFLIDLRGISDAGDLDVELP